MYDYDFLKINVENIHDDVIIHSLNNTETERLGKECHSLM